MAQRTNSSGSNRIHSRMTQKPHDRIDSDTVTALLHEMRANGAKASQSNLRAICRRAERRIAPRRQFARQITSVRISAILFRACN
jgi:hypothetical protein